MPIRISRTSPYAALAFAMATSPALAQTAAPGTVTSSASLTGIVQFKTDLDDGGDFHWGGGVAAGTITRQFTQDFSAGFTAQYTYEDWTFSSNNVAFGGKSPWSTLSRPLLGVNLAYAAAPDLILGLVPTFGWSYATAASAGDAQIYGALATATKVFSPRLVLGIGAGVYRDVGKTRAFPLVIIDWKLDDRWRISNPFPAGPSGGAGVELVYDPNERWQLAGGATYRSYRYRLAHASPYPDGVGESNSIPVFGRVTYKFGKDSRVDLYAGWLLGGKIKVYNTSDNEVASDDFNAAPILGLTIASRF